MRSTAARLGSSIIVRVIVQSGPPSTNPAPHPTNRDCFACNRFLGSGVCGGVPPISTRRHPLTLLAALLLGATALGERVLLAIGYDLASPIRRVTCG